MVWALPPIAPPSPPPLHLRALWIFFFSCRLAPRALASGPSGARPTAASGLPLLGRFHSGVYMCYVGFEWTLSRATVRLSGACRLWRRASAGGACMSERGVVAHAVMLISRVTLVSRILGAPWCCTAFWLEVVVAMAATASGSAIPSLQVTPAHPDPGPRPLVPRSAPPGQRGGRRPQEAPMCPGPASLHRAFQWCCAGARSREGTCWSVQGAACHRSLHSHAAT